MKTLNILQICFRMPYPLKDGGAIAMYNMTRGFVSSGCRLTLLIPLTKKHHFETEKLPAFIKDNADIHTVNIDSRVTVLGAFINLFTTKPYYISRYKNRKFAGVLQKILMEKEFDIIQVESLKMSMYNRLIRKYSTALIVLRSHNIEFKIWERVRDAHKNMFVRLYLRILVKRIRIYELENMLDFDALIPISQIDADFYKNMGYKKAILTVPSGIDMERYIPAADLGQPNTLFYLGSLDWIPNMEGLDWFLEEIWPLIHEKYPELMFYIAGRNMPPQIRNMHGNNIIVLGEVDDALEYMKSKMIMIVPLLAGSGMRVKIMEGLALGKVIISTSVGAEGIDYQHAVNMMIADSPEEFLSCLTALKKEEKLASVLSQNALELVRNKYNNSNLINTLLNFYLNLCSKKYLNLKRP
jgi:polysaccharide biosynthesis protein PslH